MKKIFFLVAAVALLSACQKYSYITVEGDPLQTPIYKLENGLTVYLSQNKEKPEIQTFIAVRAGAQNDPLESTGLAHYQEHIMFKGTKSYGTTDYEKEVPNLNAIDSIYELYGATTDPEERKAIYHLIDSFSYESTLLPISEVLLGAEDIPTPENSPYAKEIDGLKSVIHAQNEEIARMHEIKEHLETRITFLLDQIEKKDRRMDEKDEIIRKRLEKCL